MSWFQDSTRAFLWSLVILTLWTTLSLAAVDQTLQEKAIGKDVVETVVSRIRRSGIFTDDYEFLRRLAYAETQDGEFNNTFSWNKKGGIWNVPEIYLNKTKDVSMASFHNKIIASFRIDWTQVIWNDLLKPLYSGLAARLYLETIPVPIPQTIIGQGNYFDQYYNRKDNHNNYTFVNSTEGLENSTRTCSGKMDLVIVLDGSSSVNVGNPLNFDTCKKFVIDLIGTYSIKHVRHGFLTYASEVFSIFGLDNNLKQEELFQKVRDTEYPNAKTNTNDAIEAAVQMFLEAESRPGVPKVMTIFTDGKSNPSGVDKIALAKAANVSSYAIGITNEIDETELKELAYNIESNVFYLDDFEILADFFKRMNAETCKLPQKPKLGERVEDSLNEGERRFYEYEFSSDGAVRVQIDLKEGGTRGYYSFSEDNQNPSSAANDGVLKAKGTLIQPPLTSSSLMADTMKVYITVEGLNPVNDYVIDTQAADRDDSTTLSTTEETTTESSSTEQSSTEQSSTEPSSTESELSSTAEAVPSTTDGGTTLTVSFLSILLMGFLSLFL